MTSRRTIAKIYRRLYAAHGPQHWWPGETPFEIMVGAVLTQNTAWVNVARAIANLKRAGALSPHATAGTHPKRLAGWLKPSGYFNVKSRRLRALGPDVPVYNEYHGLLVHHGKHVCRTVPRCARCCLAADCAEAAS